ncbi:hypothetical protein QBC34DRAFT_403767 [Podospora aff. communis PSN243]|uniref:SigF-like NTF2-like domain-containing protein n=1 Tax=Podospora aff. communis PSN243 TaxID=3040156 RepID=A0AAV9GQ66_9PEZI|nr:hypothetical protein QBC34DRAFT_403767 [Podospora aff. communis PSN243]
MEHPVRDIRGVIQSIYQGTPSEQQETINRYFLPTASFTHPFVRVPSFPEKTVPLLGQVNSRGLILAIYKWYKLLSPSTTVQIESTVFDQRTNILYVTLNQTFSIWFLPFNKSPVRLVTLLHLVPDQQPQSNSSSGAAATKNGIVPCPELDLQPLGDAPSEPSFADVADPDTNTAAAAEKAVKIHTRPAPSTASSSASTPAAGAAKKYYRIARQEDLYQVNEFIKFVLMGPGAVVVGWFQLMGAAWCVLGLLVMGMVMKVFGRATEVKEEMAAKVEQGMPLMGMLVDGEGEKKRGGEKEGVKENGNSKESSGR